jgi:glutamate dehydrogenase (NAD(P)+)
MESSTTDLSNLALATASTIRVLLVEDDPDDAALIRARMSENTESLFQVEWKDNVLNAISRLAKPGIDVVLLDLGMGELSGYKTHRAIAGAIQTTPVVILTSDESAMSRDITKSQGAFAYLVKHKTSSIELKQTLHKAVLSAPL